MTLADFAFCCGLFGAGVIGLVLSLRPSGALVHGAIGSSGCGAGQDGSAVRDSVSSPPADQARTKAVRPTGPLPRVALVATAGAVAGLATGWVVAVPIGAVAAMSLPALLGQTSGRVRIGKVEAVATWTEMLQSTLAASAGLSQAIVATAPLAPTTIRDETTRLASLLEAGALPREALLQFADELGDPSADRVVCALLLAFESRGQRLAELLSALAESTREEVALRLRIETSRSAVRSSVRTVLVSSVTFAVGLVLLARPYLAPYGTAMGQLVLLLVALLYGLGLWTMVALSRPPAGLRLLGHGVVRS